MTKSVLFYSLFLLLGVFISSVSQVMLKKAAMRTWPSRVREYLNPLVIFAYVIFVGTTLLSVLAYRGLPVSLGAVLESTSYLYVTAFGVLIFHEKLTGRRVLALALILGGIAVYAFG